MGEMSDYYDEQDLYRDLSDDPGDFDETEPISREVLGLPKTEPFPMLKKTTKKPRVTKNATVPLVDARPKLIHCGNHLIDPMDVVCITKVQKHKGLYIVKLRSNPNPEFPIWVNEADITPLIQQFNVVTGE
jgi:hypothetical protein